MTNRVRIDVPVTLLGSYLSLAEGADPFPKGRLIAIESYAGSVPTFTWQADSGHIYSYLPPQAVYAWKNNGPDRGEKAFVPDFACPKGPIVGSDLGFEGPGCGLIGNDVVAWKRYLVTVDWPDGNVLAHLCLGPGGAPVWYRNARFQVGNPAAFDPPHWQKSRATWSLPPSVLDVTCGARRLHSC